MQTQRLGRTGMEITRIGFGAWAIGGGGWEFGWGAQDERAAVEAIEHALERGINWIDTAPVYGHGKSERLVGRAVRGMAERPFIFTKCSMLWDEHGSVHRSLAADSIRRECEASLRRLDIDAIDLYQIHWPEPESDIEEGWETLVRLRDEGLVRHLGVSNFDVAQMQRIARIAPVESLQPPYSLIRRAIEPEILPYCAAQDIGVIVYSPMASGLLTGAMTRERIARMPPDDWRQRSNEYQEPKLSVNLALVETLKRIGARHDVMAGAVAVAWTLRHPAVTGAIVGARSAAQVEDVIAGALLELRDDEMEELGRVTPEPTGTTAT